MPTSVQAQSSSIYSSYQTVNDQLKQVMRQASTGTRLLRPGDEPTTVEKVGSLGVDRALDMAQLQTIQTRITWYQISTAYLEEIRSTLSSMSELAIRATDGSLKQSDRASLDSQFQSYKDQISLWVDGNGGANEVGATFNTQPLFLGYGPDVQIGATNPAGKGGMQGINLLTGRGLEGYYQLALISSGTATAPQLTGTATAGSATTITLDADAAAIHDVYAGATLQIVNGTGVGQTAKITAYDEKTHIATLDTTLAVPLDNTSEYQITSAHQNEYIQSLPGTNILSIASYVWGADNDRMDQLQDSEKTFRAITPEEQQYRTLNGIPDTDLIPKTDAEKMARRQRDLFDPEFANIQQPDSARQMMETIQHAIDQITRLMSRQGAAQENLQQQYTLFSHRTDTQKEGISSLSDVDLAKAITDIQSLSDNAQVMMNIAARLSENMSRLNELVKNRGGAQ